MRRGLKQNIVNPVERKCIPEAEQQHLTLSPLKIGSAYIIYQHIFSFPSK